MLAEGPTAKKRGSGVCEIEGESESERKRSEVTGKEIER